MNISGILKNQELQNLLNKNGYVKFPLASQEEILDLLAFYNQIIKDVPDIPKDILYTCIHNKNKEFVKKMNEGLRNRIPQLMNRVLTNFKFASFTFQIKGLGEKSELFAHQDWSFCDEKYNRSYTFWLPLHDCFPKNGTIYVLPGSHQKLNKIRGAGIASVFEDVKGQAKESMIPVYLKAGEVLIFDCALGHFSPPNFTTKERVSVMSILTHSSADFMLFFGKRNNATFEVSSYKVPDDFFESYDNFETEYLLPPKSAELINTETDSEFKFTKKSFENFVLTLSSNQKWFKNFLHYFKMQLLI